MNVEDIPYRDLTKSEEFLISREALDEAHSALAGCLFVLGDTANIALAMEKLKTALGSQGDVYAGHDPQFVVAACSEPMPDKATPDEARLGMARLGMATNTELEDEMRARRETGHTHPDYRTWNYDGPVA